MQEHKMCTFNSYSPIGENIAVSQLILEEEKEQKTTEDASQAVSEISARSLFKDAFYTIWESESNDEKLYLNSNELKRAKTFKLLKEISPTRSSKPTMLACSGLEGLNLAATRDISYIIMIDRSARVQKFWQEIEKILCRVSTKEEAIQEIIATLTEQSASFWPDCTTYEDKQCKVKRCVKNLKLEISSGRSFLSTSKNFAKIKRIFDEGHFIFERVNFFDYKKIGVLSKSVSKLNLTLDMLYLSNLREYAEEAGYLPHFYASISTLFKSMHNYTVIIDTEPRVIDFNAFPKQRVISHILSRPIEVSFPPSPLPPPVPLPSPFYPFAFYSPTENPYFYLQSNVSDTRLEHEYAGRGDYYLRA